MTAPEPAVLCPSRWRALNGRIFSCQFLTDADALDVAREWAPSPSRAVEISTPDMYTNTGVWIGLNGNVVTRVGPITDIPRPLRDQLATTLRFLAEQLDDVTARERARAD